MPSNKKTGSKTKNKWVSRITKKEGGRSQIKIGDARQYQKLQELTMAEQIALQVKKRGGHTSALRSKAFRSMKARVTKLAKRMLKEQQ